MNINILKLFKKYKSTIFSIVIVSILITILQYNSVQLEEFATNETVYCDKPVEGAVRRPNGYGIKSVVPVGLDSNCNSVYSRYNKDGLWLCGGKSTRRQNLAGFYDDDCTKRWYVDDKGNVCDKNSYNIRSYINRYHKCPGDPKIVDTIFEPIEFSSFIPSDIQKTRRNLSSIEAKRIGNNYMLFYTMNITTDISMLSDSELYSLGYLIYTTYKSAKKSILEPNDTRNKEEFRSNKAKLNTMFNTLKQKIIVNRRTDNQAIRHRVSYIR